MNDKRKVLGRGLESLLPGPGLPTVVPGAQRGGGRDIPLDMLDPNPYQTRSHVREEGLKDLAESIKVSGVVQPVVVRPLPNGRFQLVAGERRWLASKRAGKTTIPAVVREISNEQAMEITIIENLQREDLNPVEQARAFDRLSREFNLTQEQIASRTGKDRASISNFIRLLRLPAMVLEQMEKGTLTLGHGKLLCSLTGHPEELAKAAEQVVAKNLSVRQTEELVLQILNPEGTGKKKPKVKPVDPNVREAARTLERALGMKVEIEDRKGRGKIVLKYASLDEFQRVVDALAGK
ncbi:MAG TPA: ParB/RepB/Spo0J family partition protein [Candidatus Saccharimonadales bacterium]|jgi:ParB family chromosome partitioning protein|nr:ParB/RepB/Spo0J family partition protein [Candidatus Saccharimonadales bacterium]